MVVVSAIVAGFYFILNLAPDSPTAAVVPEFVEAGFQFATVDGMRSAIVENDFLLMRIDRGNLIFSVLDKRTGRTWLSSLVERDEELNNTWLMFFNAPVTLEFVDSSNTTRRAYSTRDGTVTNFKASRDRVECAVEFSNIGARLKLSYELDGYSLRIGVEELSEGEYKITALYLYPFLGSSRGLVPGEIVLADGVGSYMDLSKSTSATAPFRKRLYGDDIGLREVAGRTELNFVSDAQLYTLPMYGFILSGSGLLVVIEDGDVYAEVHASRSGIITPYNWCTARFVLRDFHKKLLNKKGEGVTIVQERMNSVKPKLRFVFLKEPNRLTFAREFVEVKKRTFPKNSVDSVVRNPLAGFRLEFLVFESRRGVLGFERVTATEPSRLLEVLERLENALDGLVVVRGVSEMGESRDAPRHLPIPRELLSILLKSNGEDDRRVPLALRLNYFRAHRTSRSLRRSWVAQNLLEQLIEIDGYYALDPSKIANLVLDEARRLSELGFRYLLLAEVGKTAHSTLASERAEVIANVRKILEELGHPIVESAIWPYVPFASALSSVPLDHSGYEIEDGEVPLLPNVLKHFAVLYSQPVNLSSDPDREILKCVDYGVYPSFVLTWDDPIELVNTPLRNLYSTKLEDWFEFIVETYAKTNEVLSHVTQLATVKRTRLANEVFLNEYEDSSRLIVNYGDAPYVHEGETIPPMGWRLVKPTDRSGRGG